MDIDSVFCDSDAKFEEILEWPIHDLELFVHRLLKVLESKEYNPKMATNFRRFLCVLYRASEEMFVSACKWILKRLKGKAVWVTGAEIGVLALNSKYAELAVSERLKFLWDGDSSVKDSPLFIEMANDVLLRWFEYLSVSGCPIASLDSAREELLRRLAE